MTEVVPVKKQKGEKPCWWYFTFGSNSSNEGKCIKLYGTYSGTRGDMFEMFGNKWAFQYSEHDWESMKSNPDRTWPMEKLVDIKDVIQED